MQQMQAHYNNLIPPTARIIDKLSPAARADFDSRLHTSSYPTGRILFTEREPATGIYVVLEGEVHVSINSIDGKRLALRIARGGEILGLSSVLSGSAYNATAEAFYPSKVAYVARETLILFLSNHPDAYQVVVEELSRKVSVACEQLRILALSNSAPEKLARLLLEWSENEQVTQQGCRVHFALTHEQIGEFIGASRETVTRTLASFKRERLIKFDGVILTIPNRAALARYTAA
jgi:CRP/FNR family transcriptional regulator, cyclic AMP receptor protein